jgi:putative pyoverdin transport system ATP-binding/permease protein
MSWLLSLARASRATLIAALVTSVLAGLGGSGVVVLINSALGAAESELPGLGIRFAAASLAMLSLRWLSQVLFARLRHGTLARLRGHIGHHFAEAPYRDLERWGAARLWAVLVEDLAAISELFVAVPRLLTQGAIVIGCLVYLAWLSWEAFLVALLVVVLGSFARSWGGARGAGFLSRARDLEEALYGHFRALLDGAKELRLNALRRRDFVDGVLAHSAREVRRQRRRGLLIYAAAASWGSFLFFVVMGAVIFGLSAVLGLPREVRAGYALMLLYMMHPMELLMEAVPELARARVALDQIRALGIEPIAPARPAAALAGPRPARPVRFENLQLRGVTHRYRREADDGVFTLGPLDLELRPGEVVMVVGGNGSGKTTLAKLLVGLYAPETGSLVLNGAAVRLEDAEQVEAYRQHFCAVFSDYHLFDQLLGVDAAHLDERAHQLLRLLELDHKVLIRGGAFSTTELSHGQRKRLALLVAWLEDRPVCVFDEWAADQDPAYKDVFYKVLLPELRARGKAVLVISHDDHYFHVADRCLKLEAGCLGEAVAAANTRVLAPRVSMFAPRLQKDDNDSHLDVVSSREPWQ